MAATPRCLILFGDGCLVDEAILDSVDCPALDQTAKEGCSGELALRELADGVAEGQRSLLELSQLLDLESSNEQLGSGASSAGVENGEAGNFKSLKERFMSMSATLYSNSQAVTSLGSEAGFHSQPLTGHESSSPSGAFPDASNFAEQLLRSLGLGKGVKSTADDKKTDGLGSKDGDSQKEQDLVLVHLTPNVSDDSNGAQASTRLGSGSMSSTSDREEGLLEQAKACLKWLDALVAALRELVSRDSDSAARLYLVLVLSYHVNTIRKLTTSTNSGTTPESERLQGEAGASNRLLSFRPMQSYQQKDGQKLTNIREHHHALVVYNSHGLTRRDAVQSLRTSEITAKSGNLTILADRFLHEVAFKIGRAPKYGA